MDENQKIAVKGISDILYARMRVRELARAAGLNTRDQARIALATSSLAQAMRLGSSSKDRIEIYSLESNGERSVQVVCITEDRAMCDLGSKTFSDARWMVDQLSIEMLGQSGLQSTLLKRAP